MRKFWFFALTKWNMWLLHLVFPVWSLYSVWLVNCWVVLIGLIALFMSNCKSVKTYFRYLNDCNNWQNLGSCFSEFPMTKQPWVVICVKLWICTLIYSVWLNFLCVISTSPSWAGVFQPPLIFRTFQVPQPMGWRNSTFGLSVIP
jgi:hypothetical protein